MKIEINEKCFIIPKQIHTGKVHVPKVPHLDFIIK